MTELGWPLLSMPEIAALAGVKRPVVSNWRRRHSTFPTPVSGADGKPLFDAGRVVGWLADDRGIDRSQLEAELALHILAGLSVGMSGRHLVGSITALICLRHLDAEPLTDRKAEPPDAFGRLRARAAAADPEDWFVRAEVEALDNTVGWLPVTADSLIEAAWGCAAAYERVLAARARLGVAELYADAPSPALTRLAAGLCGAQERIDTAGFATVMDPATGIGDLLVGVIDALADDAEFAFSGVEPDAFLTRIARRRLVVHGIGMPDVDIAVDRSSLDDDARFDSLVTCLPYAPKEVRSRSDAFDTVERIADGLAGSQTAVVIGPADILVGGLPPGLAAVEAARTKLLTCGVVEAVVSLPGGQLPFRPGYQTALWVLRRESQPSSQGRILVADVSDRALTDDVVEDLVLDVITWRRAGYRPAQHARAIAVPVDVAVLTQPRTRLVARQPAGIRVATAGAAAALATANEIETELDRLAASSREAVRSCLAVQPEPYPVSRVRLQDVVAVVPGTRLDADEVVRAGSQVVLGPEEVIGLSPVGGRVTDLLSFSQRHANAGRTERGDVVLTLVPRLGVLVDHDGGSVVEYPARVLRIRPIHQDLRPQLTPRVLAALLVAEPHLGRARGAVRAATQLSDFRIPLLPPEEVSRLDALLAAADERRRLAQRELDLLDELCRAAAAGVADGTLTLGG